MSGFAFSIGDELQYTAYSASVGESMIDSPTENQTYTIQFEGWVPCPGMSTVTDIEGNIYNTVQIDNQCWMKENLRTTKYQDNTAIPNVMGGNDWSNLTNGAYVWYNNNHIWKDVYGALYNWYAIEESYGICPTGWHVPSNADWDVLVDFFGGGNSPAGNELKSCRQLNSPLGGDCNTTEHPRWVMNATHYGTNDHGFTSIPGGYRSSAASGQFSDLGSMDTYWTTDQITSSQSWTYGMYSTLGGIYKFYFNKKRGFAVRCLKD